MQDELSKARVRLRRAEDFEIKYELILKQNANLTSDLEKMEKDLCELKSNNEQLKVRVEDRQVKTEDFTSERRALQEEIDKWKNKYEES